MGVENLRFKNLDMAFDNFTNVLKQDAVCVEAMENRAKIHFTRNEFECCVIECEEIQRLRSSDEIKKLMEEAKKNIKEKTWFETLGVSPSSPKPEVVAASKKLTLKYNPGGRINAKLSKLDKAKLQRKMSSINKAKKEFETIHKHNMK